MTLTKEEQRLFKKLVDKQLKSMENPQGKPPSLKTLTKYYTIQAKLKESIKK